MLLRVAVETWQVAGEMAPYLLFGFLAAGALSAFVSPAWLERHLGGPGFMPVLKSVLLGVPLPLCSCGVIAVTASIRSRGASRAAATGFLLSTPQTGVDSILATWGMLGPVLGVARPVIALFSGLAGGLLVGLLGEKETPKNGPAEKPACSDGCCSGGHDDEAPATAGARILHALHYGLVVLPRDIARPLVAGVALAGLISALVPPDALSPYLGGGLAAMLAMIALGIPLYVCATASIPLAVGFMHMGASPGAALAFLIAGPGTNAATVATVWKMMGPRTCLVYLFTVAATALLAGLAYDGMIGGLGGFGVHLAGHAHHEAELAAGAGGHVFALLLLAVLAHSVYEKRINRLFTRKMEVETAPPPEGGRVVLHVKGMTCSHCAAAVTRALKAASGSGDVLVDLEKGRAEVSGASASPEVLRQAVADLGYDVTVSL